MSVISAKKIIIGLSGGVDSAVAALLLKQQGYALEAVFMKNWEADGDNNCTAPQDLIDAQSICLKLGIRLHTVNFSNEYWDNVFAYFLAEYKAGRTPNPDILCNQEIKFKAFLNYALDLGADYIATGHYAGIARTPDWQLIKSKDLNKDQSYFLYRISKHALAKSIFPLQNITKPEVRMLAQKAGFRNYAKKDSTGICFIGERKFKLFLQHYLPSKPGNIETPEGKIIGKHDGLMYYTLGQRQGLGIGGIKNTSEAPWYVLKKDLTRNILIVGQGEHPMLFNQFLKADHLHWINSPPAQFPFLCTAKIRYRQSDQSCKIKNITNGMVEVEFDLPQRAITPGQSIVFYQNNTCLGGGIIQ